MAYNIRARITCTDPSNTNFMAFEDSNAISIMQEFINDGRCVIIQDSIGLDHRIIETSYTDKATYLELRQLLDAINNYRRSDVTIYILSEG